MIELRKFAHELNQVIGINAPYGRNPADEINEKHWFELVINKLNTMSIDCARELQVETGTYPKPGHPVGQHIEKAPPTRLLSLCLILSYWLGWVSNEKHMDSEPVKAWTRIEEAYMARRLLSEIRQVL
jgi:hypothetical protein